jgi:RNA polymerase sigma factor (sigma-70 family)
MKNEDVKLVENIQNNQCDKSLRVLIDRHTPLCYTILQKFYPMLSKNGFSKDDIFNDKDYLIYKSAMLFKTDKKTKFSTWIGNYTRYHCLNLLNSKKGQVLISTEDESVKNLLNIKADDQTSNDSNTEEFVSYILSELHDKRVQKIYMMRYFSKDGKKKTWKEIAKKLGVSSQTVINIHNKAKRILRNKFKSKNNFDFV